MINPLDYLKPLKEKQVLFRNLFSSVEGHRVLMDLAAFCHFDSTTFDPDSAKHSRNEGKRQVILYILQTMKMSIPELEALDNERHHIGDFSGREHPGY